MKKITKWLALSTCSLMFCACAVPLATWAIGKADDKVVWEEITLEEQYVVCDTLQIPSRSVSVGENTYQADVKVVYPDGTTKTATENEILLSSAGRYTLIYQAKDVNSQYHTEKVDFIVADMLWQTSNPKSSVSYGKVGKTDALIVELARGDALTFNKIIDVSTLTSDVTLLEGFINPSNVGVYEFEQLSFTFTDVQDPTQTLTVLGSRSKSSDSGKYAMSYWTAAGANQSQGGFNGTNFTSIEQELGLRGTPIQASFYSYGGTWYLNDPNDPSKGSSIDLKQVVADETPFKIALDTQNVEVSVNSKKVADLDNPTYYEKEPLWGGFPSGKVTLTVQALECVGEAANFCISKLLSYDFAAENQFIETEKPEINVEVDEKYVEYKQNRYSFIPYAVVGGKYGVPSATAFDNYSGALSVETKVYYNYGNESARIECPIQNGKFAVTRNGAYAIVYKATDHMGNVEEKVYWITAVKELSNPLTISLGETETREGVCGRKLTVETPNISGGSGDANVKIQASCGDMTLDVADGGFIAEKAGDWTITYTATDYAGISVEASYVIRVENGTVPVFVDEPVLPQYLVSGMQYTVPTVYAYDYTSGTKTQRLADVIVKDANGERTYKAGERYTPIATEEKPVITLVFSIGGATLEKEIPAVLALQEKNGRTFVYVEKMFITDNLTATRDKSGLTLTAEEDGAAAWNYVNPVVANNASLKVKGIKGQTKFGGLKVTFTDYANGNISVTAYLENGANGYARVNFGDVDREMTKGFNLGTDSKGNALDEFVFSYKDNKFYVDSISVAVKVDDNGNAFNGFPSGKVYISAEAVDMQSGASYLVKQFDNQTIGSLVADTIAPRITIDGLYGGMYQVNDMYTITTAMASDTIDADVACYLTVKDSKGNIVTDVDGVRLESVLSNREYSITLTTYGQYIVEYNAVDCFGNKSNDTSYTINVFDKVAPTIKVSNTWSATASVGEQVVLPKVSVEDNYSSTENITVYRYVRNPNGVVVAFGYDYVQNEAGEWIYVQYKHTFGYAGEYRFVIVVCDETGNQAVAQYTVTVK